ncbi:uncharacterized protein PHALS_01095 [Plasmopara halstedii]|uniref:Uncharacterized protein n=1 Tax=Plasmopara halstedii TaxID=4781 RepID=A0A0P1AST4_PLAHL|nr:uncharacterized protein PHALS_01095 [Plasmopara halstedii]CEG44757.1 hypothetical protein PHALS_01095 [Plasmopara halstedii]|eukprot:XP_024581126.1 hypothetical protein PHALS_01095 [Plasmopara halstedii]
MAREIDFGFSIDETGHVQSCTLKMLCSLSSLKGTPASNYSNQSCRPQYAST